MDDATTVQRCLEGEPDAFRTLVERYQGRALGHAIAIIRNRDDAQDAVHDAFLNAHRALRTFDRERVFYSWFYAILRNCCYKLIARRRMEAVDDAVRLAVDTDRLESRKGGADGSAIARSYGEED